MRSREKGTYDLPVTPAAVAAPTGRTVDVFGRGIRLHAVRLRGDKRGQTLRQHFNVSRRQRLRGGGHGDIKITACGRLELLQLIEQPVVIIIGQIVAHPVAQRYCRCSKFFQSRRSATSQ